MDHVDIISDSFISCLNKLTSEKVTDRKFGAENFRKFLCDVNVIQALDDNSSQKIKNDAGGVVTWSSILKVVKKYIEMEAEKILSKVQPNENKPLTSAMIQSKSSCVSLFKCLVKAAGQSRPKAKPPNFFPYILKILSNRGTLYLLGQEFTSILNKDVLTSDILLSEMSSEILSNVLKVYRDFYLNSTWKKSLLLDVMQKLINLTNKIDLNKDIRDLIFTFFREVVLNIKEESLHHHESFIGVLINFSKINILDCRQGVCDLGEKIIPCFANIWSSTKSDAAKLKLIEFFYIQTVVHNPGGSWSTGKYVCDTLQWNSNLKSIFDIIIKECRNCPQKSKYSISGVSLKPEFVELAIEVCSLVLMMKEDDVQSENFKKPRSIYSISTLLDPLKKLKTSFEIVPWVRVISGLLFKYPNVIEMDDILKLMETILLIQISCKQVKVRSVLLLCSSALVSAYLHKETKKNIHVFGKLFEHTVRMVALNHCHHESHGLLQILLTNKLANPTEDFQRLYMPGSSNLVSSSSLKTLICFLRNFPIPCTLISTNQQPKEKYWYQMETVQWIFSYSEDCLAKCFQNDLPCISALANALIFLCFREGQSCLTYQEPEQSNDCFAEYDSIRQELLKSTFDSPLFVKIGAVQEFQRSGLNKLSFITPLLKQVLLSVENETGHLLDPSQVFSIDLMAKQVCFLIILQKLLWKHEFMSSAEITASRLTEHTKEILRKIGATLISTFDNLKVVQEVLNSLRIALDYDAEIPEASDWVWSLFPDNLLESLLAILNDQNLETSFNLTLTARRFTPGSSSTQINSSFGREDLEYLMEDDDLSSQQPSTCAAKTTSFGSDNQIDKMASLSFFKQNVSKLLVKLFFSEFVKYHTLKPENYRDQLKNYISFERLNLLVIANVHLIISVMGSLVDCGDVVEDEEIAYILSNIRAILRKYKTQNDFSIGCIGVLEKCIPHLIPKENEKKARTENRKLLLSMIKALWGKEKEEPHELGYICALINITSSLLKFDVEISWCDYNPSKETKLESPILDLVRMLQSSKLKIRIQSSAKIGHFLSDITLYSPWFEEKRNVIFDECYTICVNSCGIVESSSISPCLSTLLAFLIHISSAGLRCERDAIFALVQIVKLKNVPIDIIFKVLSQIQNKQSLSSELSVLELHFDFIFKHWLDLRNPFKDFPFEIVKCQTLREFYRNYQMHIIPLLFWRMEPIELDEIAKVVGKETKTLIIDSLCQIFAGIASRFAVENTKDNRQATQCLQFLQNTITKKVLEQQVTLQLHKIVTRLFLSLNESPIQPQLKRFKNFLPPPTKIQNESQKIIKSFAYLAKQYGRESVIEIISDGSDCGISNILFALHQKIAKAERKEERCRIILVYHFFLEIVLPYFKSNLKTMATFVVREITLLMLNQFNRLSNPLLGLDECIATLAIMLLQTLVSNCIDVFVDGASELIPEIVDGVLKIFNNGSISVEITQLLNILVIEKTSSNSALKGILALVDDLPDTPSLLPLNAIRDKLRSYKNDEETLIEVMQNFLQGCKWRKNSTRKEGLVYLLNQLRNRKEELIGLTLYHQNNTSLTEDLEESLLHLATCYLLSFSQSSSEEIQQVAAQCLGEIGSVNLGSPILPAIIAKKNVSTFYSSEEYLIYDNLATYLADERLSVFEAATTVMKNLLSTPEGKRFLNKCKSHGEKKVYQRCLPLASNSNTAESSVLKENVKAFVPLVDDDTLWCPEGPVVYQTWISQLVCSILNSVAQKSSIFKDLKPICLVEPTFCEKILPYLISKVLEHNNANQKEILSRQISNFVAKHCWIKKKIKTSQDSDDSFSLETSQNSLFLQKRAVQAILNIVHHLRMRAKEKTESTILETEFSLSIDYLHMADAALYCGAFFTSLMYIELWCDETSRVMKSNEDPDFDSQGSTIISRLGTNDQVEVLQLLLLDAFKEIGDYDGVHGCSRLFGDSFPIRLCLYAQENKWDRVLSVCDLEMICDNAEQTQSVLIALKKSGLTNTFEGFLNGLMVNCNQPSSEMVEYQSECAWRMNRWNIMIPEVENQGVHQSLFKALNYLEIKDYESSLNQISIGRRKILNEIYLLGATPEAAKSIYPILSNLQVLSTVEMAIRHQSKESMDTLIDAWDIANRVPFSSFEFFEPTLWIQAVIFRQIINRDHRRGSLLKGLISTLEKTLNFALSENHLEIAEKALRELKKEYRESNESSLHVKLDEARLYWCRGETHVAKQLLKSLLKPLELQQQENTQKKFLYAKTLLFYGKWQAETSGENISTILSNYLEKALSLFKQTTNKELLYDGHLAIARYSDAHYQSLIKYRNTPAFQTKMNTMVQARDEAKLLKKYCDKTNIDDRKAISLREKQSNIDESEVKAVEENLKKYRIKALENYLFCLRDTRAHDLRVFRVISLWFENCQDPTVNKIIQTHLDKLPTYKFLTLMYQLAARMGTQGGEFHRILSELIKRMCLDHPHHTIPVLMSLSNANRDPTYRQPTQSSSRGKKSLPTIDAQEDRITSAKDVISHVEKVMPDYILQLRKLCEAYIELAYHSTTQYKPYTKQKIPSNISLHRCSFDKVSILTQEPKIDYTCEYKKIAYVKNFGPEFYLCNGVNAPKRIECYNSNGQKHLQLVKGQDDLRQDAVMQQVFALVNCFLEKNGETQKRRLNIRTYKIVPLSRRSGVLQWCDGTQPIGEYLVGRDHKSGAHKRYYPSEWNAREARSCLAQPNTEVSKLQLYEKICENFSPVFRYFFLEHFPEPTKWYERRLAYSRSVAVCSIVGYVLGLGDRHVHNILVDKHTAELIHIDFGVAFEQGKILATPETVPFRLTREIVDGFGICGVEGVFRRCCEKTMEVMRGSQESLLTILEVLLYDPLYMWSISPDKAASLQKLTVKDQQNKLENDSENQGQEINKLAERVLLQLQQKLQGVEDNVALSVSGQVGLLIQQARDPQNLARLFPGWQPYL